MSAAAEIQPMFFDEEDKPEVSIQFDSSQIAPVTPYSDDIHDEYEAAQEQLRQLRQQEEQLRRQAAELEELTQREEEFTTGRERLRESLTESLQLLQQESEEARRLAEECTEAHNRLQSQLANLDSLHPESWSRADRRAELTRAMGYLESAEEEIDAHQPLIDSFQGGKRNLFANFRPAKTIESAATGTHDFHYWLKSGFAFSIPLLAFAIIVMLFLLVF